MFDKEIDMQKLFITQLKNKIKSNEFIYEEFNGRFGNADVVKVTLNNYNSLSLHQMEVLKDYQCAKITGYLHKQQSHSIKYLMDKTDYTYTNIIAILNKLKKENIVTNDDKGMLLINKDFEFPNIEFTSYELKLKNWKNAIIQENKNKNFSSSSYIAIPMDLAIKLYKKEKDIFVLYNVGLVGIDGKGYKTFFKPKIEKNKTSKNPTYISSLAKIVFNEKEQII